MSDKGIKVVIAQNHRDIVFSSVDKKHDLIRILETLENECQKEDIQRKISSVKLALCNVKKPTTVFDRNLEIYGVRTSYLLALCGLGKDAIISSEEAGDPIKEKTEKYMRERFDEIYDHNDPETKKLASLIKAVDSPENVRDGKALKLAYRNELFEKVGTCSYDVAKIMEAYIKHKELFTGQAKGFRMDDGLDLVFSNLNIASEKPTNDGVISFTSSEFKVFLKTNMFP